MSATASFLSSVSHQPHGLQTIPHDSRTHFSPCDFYSSTPVFNHTRPLYCIVQITQAMTPSLWSLICCLGFDSVLFITVISGCSPFITTCWLPDLCLCFDYIFGFTLLYCLLVFNKPAHVSNPDCLLSHLLIFSSPSFSLKVLAEHFIWSNFLLNRLWKQTYWDLLHFFWFCPAIGRDTVLVYRGCTILNEGP